jgi:lipopolysaccharide export system protein LptC
LRHSLLVRGLRIGVPVAIIAALVTVVAANYLPTVGGFRLATEIGPLVIKGTKVTMQQPRLTGFTIDSRPYDFTANSAEQDLTKPDLMELQQIRAKIEMEDKSMVNITADNGRYDMKGEILTLLENVRLVSSTGYEVRLSEATVDVHKGTVLSEKPVSVKLTNGMVNAQRLEVLDSGEIIRFGGGVAMTVNPEHFTQASDR